MDLGRYRKDTVVVELVFVDLHEKLQVLLAMVLCSELYEFFDVANSVWVSELIDAEEKAVVEELVKRGRR